MPYGITDHTVLPDTSEQTLH